MSYQEEKVFAPWMSKSTAQIKNTNVKLHNEIIEFTKYIQPNPLDIDKREMSIQ